MYLSEKNIVQLASGNWYIETRTGFEGPFENHQEAVRFLQLITHTEAARAEFAGLQFTSPGS